MVNEMNDEGGNFRDKVVTIHVNNFDESSTKCFYEDFKKSQSSGQQVLPVVIDSYGGAVDSVVAMMDLLDSSKIPVATICLGKAMSCGSILLSCGKEGMRYISPSSRVMIHSPWTVAFGNSTEVEITTEELKRLKFLLLKKMAKNCNQPANYFLNLFEKNNDRDIFLTPSECLKHKLVNHIKIPEIKIVTKTTVEII